MTGEPQQDRERTIKVLTLILAVAWVGSLVVRIYQPGWAMGSAIDSLMVSVVGYHFAKTGLSQDKKAGAG